MNNGFDGIAVKKGEKYDFSVFSKVLDDTKGGKVLVRLSLIHISMEKEGNAPKRLFLGKREVPS